LMGVGTCGALPNLSHQTRSRPQGLSSRIPRSLRSVVICRALALVLLALGGRSRTGANCNYGCNYRPGRDDADVPTVRALAVAGTPVTFDGYVSTRAGSPRHRCCTLTPSAVSDMGDVRARPTGGTPHDASSCHAHCHRARRGYVFAGVCGGR
jgi:hypothetical protein